MKRNVNVFIAVVLVAVLCGGIVWLRTADDEKLGWNIHDNYGDAPAYSNNGAAYTNATFAGPSNDGGVMTLSPSRTMRHSAAPSYAGAYTISYGVNSMPLTSNLSPLTSAPTGAGLYTTSSKTFNSYGGGGNGGAVMGGAMSNGRSNSGASNPSLQGGAGVGSISPIAYSTARRSDMTVGAGENLAQMAAENPVMAMANAASAGNGFYGGYTAMDYSGSANYGQYTGMFGGGSRSNVRGRQNVSPWESWLKWLAENESTEDGYGTYSDGTYYYSEEQLRAAYDSWKEWYTRTWGPNAPSFEAWWEWMLAGGYDGYVYGDNTYRWVPVGDIIPLLILVLLYTLVMYLRPKFFQRVNNKN